MNDQHKKIMLDFNKSIVKLKEQSRLWLMASSVIAVGVMLTIVFSENISNLYSVRIWWTVGSIGLIVSVNWWYWTLSLIRTLLNHQINIVKILSEITTDVKGIKTDINSLNQKGLIK